MWIAFAGTIAAATAITAAIFVRGRGSKSSSQNQAPSTPVPPPLPRGRRDGGSSPAATPPAAPSQLPQTGSAAGFTRMYTPALWMTAIGPYAAIHQVPLPYVAASLAEESGGNPCAIGDPEKYGPDGNPREVGIYQFYNPDDLQFLKITGAELRAYCSPQKVPYHTKDGRTIMGPSQEVIRPLTATEMGVQAKATVDKIVKSRDVVSHYAMVAGLRWPTDGIDFWRLVKLDHGLPGLVASGLLRVTAHLGRAPISWAEYRHLIESRTVLCDDKTEAYRGSDNYGWIFNNAEKATQTMQGKAIA